MKADLTSLAGWLRHATDVLRSAGVASPRNDAERLAACALGVRWSDLWAPSADAVGPRDVDRLNELLRRRAKGEPLGYIEGSVVFYALELACGPGVLVPRPETETLVDVVLELIDGVPAPRVVDIGCGTGAVGLAVGARRSDAEVWLTDISEDALVYARRNAYMWHANAKIVRGDLFGSLPDELRGEFDVVVSNPPYVRSGTSLPVDVTREPDVALFGGDDGLDIVRRIVDEAPSWLSGRGGLAFEIGDEQQADALSRVIAGAQVRADLNGRARVVWARS